MVTFGDDHTPGADLAWGWIVAQAWPGWSVDVITVAKPRKEVVSLYMHDPLREFTPDRPRQVPVGAAFTSIRYLTTSFDARAILCDEHSGAVLVVGARDEVDGKAQRLGGTAQWLVRHPSSPVIIARQQTPVRTVLACVDGSRNSQSAVEALAMFPWISGTQVSIVAVHEGHDGIPEAVATAESTLARAGATVTSRIIEAGTGKRKPSPKTQLVAEAERLNPDLIALGTAGRALLSRTRLGPVATAVVKATECSVLLADTRG